MLWRWGYQSPSRSYDSQNLLIVVVVVVAVVVEWRLTLAPWPTFGILHLYPDSHCVRSIPNTVYRLTIRLPEHRLELVDVPTLHVELPMIVVVVVVVEVVVANLDLWSIEIVVVVVVAAAMMMIVVVVVIADLVVVPDNASDRLDCYYYYCYYSSYYHLPIIIIKTETSKRPGPFVDAVRVPSTRSFRCYWRWRSWCCC